MKSKTVGNGRSYRSSQVKAEMFGQLTSGLEAAWTKLKGEGSCKSLKLISSSASILHFCILFCLPSLVLDSFFILSVVCSFGRKGTVFVILPHSPLACF